MINLIYFGLSVTIIFGKCMGCTDNKYNLMLIKIRLLCENVINSFILGKKNDF
jgi:hypothetical protein